VETAPLFFDFRAERSARQLEEIRSETAACFALKGAEVIEEEST